MSKPTIVRLQLNVDPNQWIDVSLCIKRSSSLSDDYKVNNIGKLLPFSILETPLNDWITSYKKLSVFFEYDDIKFKMNNDTTKAKGSFGPTNSVGLEGTKKNELVAFKECNQLALQLKYLFNFWINNLYLPSQELNEVIKTQEQIKWIIDFSQELQSELRNEINDEKIERFSNNLLVKIKTEIEKKNSYLLNELSLVRADNLSNVILGNLFDREEDIRIILETEHHKLKQLPWLKWNLTKTYPKAEIVLGSNKFKRITTHKNIQEKLKILVIIGGQASIEKEAKNLKLLDDAGIAEIKWLVKPSLSRHDLDDNNSNQDTLDDYLWGQKWSILFFFGHGDTEENGRVGKIQINDTQWIKISQLREHLKTLVNNGLQLAFISACNGLGIAYQLTEGEEIYFPQTVIMKQLLFKPLAPTLVQYFLEEFIGFRILEKNKVLTLKSSKGKSLELALKATRKRLKILEKQYPCASWLSIICTSGGEELSLYWEDLGGISVLLAELIILLNKANQSLIIGNYKTAINFYDQVIEDNELENIDTPQTPNKDELISIIFKAYLGKAIALNKQEESIAKIEDYLSELIKRQNDINKYLSKLEVSKFYALKALIEKDKYFLNDDKNQVNYIDITEQNFRIAIEKYSGLAEAHLELAEFFKKSSDSDNKKEADTNLIDTGERIFTEIINKNPKNLEALIGLGRSFTYKKKYEDANDIFKRGLEINQKCPRLYNYFALALLAQEKYEDVSIQIKKSIEIDGELGSTNHILGLSLREQEKTDEAIREFDIAIGKKQKQERDICQVLLDYGLTLIRSANEKLSLIPQNKNDNEPSKHKTNAINKFQKAEKKLKLGISLNPYLPSFNSLLGYVIYQIGKLNPKIRSKDEGRKLCEDTSNNNYGDYYAHYITGIVLMEENEIDDAINEFRTAIGSAPEEHYFYENLAYAYYTKEDYHNAEIQFKEAVKLKPKNAKYHHGLGWMLYNQNKIHEAKQHFDLCIKYNDKVPDYYYSLAQVLYEIISQEEDDKKKDELLQIAKENCQKAISLSTNNPNASYFNLIGNILYSLEYFRDSAMKYKRAIELEPKQKVFYENIFNALRKITDTQELQEILNELTPLLENIISNALEIEEEKDNE